MTPRTHDHTQRPFSRQLLWLITTVLIAVVLTWWATATAFKNSGENTTAPQAEELWAGATQTQIGKTYNYHAAAVTPHIPVAVNHLSGTVTEVGGGEVSSGDALYTVDNTSVYALPGNRPFYRSLEPGTRGWDVKQLQAALAETDHYEGTPNGVFDANTTAAVRAWQTAIGATATGELELGHAIAIKQLPATVRVDEAIAIGAQVSGGEPAVHAAAGEQTFELNVTAEQAKMIPQDATLTLTYKKHSWPAVLGESTDSDGGVRFALAAPNGGRVCGKDCAALPTSERFTLPVEIEVVPKTSGVGIPLAAVNTDASGGTTVETREGTVPVTVLATGGGVAIVEELEVGTEVKISAARNQE